MDGMTLLDYALALVPVLLMTALFVWLDVFKLMSLGEILLLLLIGMIVALAAYPISGRLIDALPLGFSFYSKFVAPWIEEGLKAIAVAMLIGFNRIGYKVDAVISGFAIGAGFSVLENIFYLQRFADLPPPVWMVRGLGTALMHGTACAVMASITHELAERENREADRFWFNPLWLLPGLLVAGLLHMGFNQFPDQPVIAMSLALVATPVVLLAIFHFGSREAESWLNEESAAHRAALAEIDGGGWPNTPSGRQLAALAAKGGSAHAGEVRDYLSTAMRLMVAAEEKLLGKPIPPADELRAGFERLETLERAMGRARFAALRPLLPFSRNDRWEMKELREDIEKGAL